MTANGSRAALLALIGEARKEAPKLAEWAEVQTRFTGKSPHKGIGMTGAVAAVRSLAFPSISAIARHFGVTMPAISLSLKAGRERGLITQAEQDLCFAKAKLQRLEAAAILTTNEGDHTT